MLINLDQFNFYCVFVLRSNKTMDGSWILLKVQYTLSPAWFFDWNYYAKFEREEQQIFKFRISTSLNFCAIYCHASDLRSNIFRNKGYENRGENSSIPWPGSVKSWSCQFLRDLINENKYGKTFGGINATINMYRREIIDKIGVKICRAFHVV